jgi:hypothetical protein
VKKKHLFALVHLGVVIALGACATQAPIGGSAQPASATVIGTSTVASTAPAMQTSAPTATTLPTSSSTALPSPTPTAIPPTATPKPPSNQAMVQLTDNSVVFIDATGRQTALGKVPVQLSSGLYAPAVAGDTAYAQSVGLPPGAFAINPREVHALGFMGTNLTGVATWSEPMSGQTLLAWGTYTTTGDTGFANIIVGRPDGSDARVVLTETATSTLPNLVPIRWSADGKTLYYSSEPTGLGGYIPFAGYSGLQKVDVASGITTTLVPKQSLGTICLDDLSADANLVVQHCDEKSIQVLNLATGKSTIIVPPVVFSYVAVMGSAMFNPDATRVVFAMAHGDPQAEQGWLAVSSGMRGGARLVYTSTAGSYVRAAGWLDPDTIVFQETSVTGQSNAPNTVLAVSPDGSNLRQLAQGNVLTIAAPTLTAVTIQDAGITWRLNGNPCQSAVLSATGVEYGPCGGTMTTTHYAEAWAADAYMHYIQTYAPFTAQTVAGSLIFTGTGQTVATPAEQRLIAEFARLATTEAAAGHGSAAAESTISWHREGGFAGFCDNVVVTVYGKSSATSCRGQVARDLGSRWMTSAELEQLYNWVDQLKPFTIDHKGPVQPDELVITSAFVGNGTQDASRTEQQVIQDFAQMQLTLIARP